MPFWNIYFTGDIHGSEVCFRKFLRAADIYDVKTLVISGDLVGKAMVPIIKHGTNYLAEFGGIQRTLESDKAVREFEIFVGDAGYYPYVTTQDEMEELRKDKEKSEQVVNRLVVKRISEWVEKLENAALTKKIKFYISPGNDDPFCVDEALSTSQVVINPEERVVAVHEQIDMLTFGYSNPTPWDTDRELPEDKLYEKLKPLAASVQAPSRCIFNLHAPPYNTIIDLAPNLTKDFQIKGGLNDAPLQHVGSTSVRKIIEEYQPLVAVHGHIHEAAGVDKIGNTRCFNPGSEYGQGVLRGVLLNFEVGKKVQFKNHLSLSG